jgi:hypothetical protein
LGIRTSSPAYPLSVAKANNSSVVLAQLRNSDAGSSAATSFAFGNDTTAEAARIVYGSSTNSGIPNSLFITNDLAGSIILRTDGTERFRIAATGAFGLSGASYGTSGQVLTSGGSGAAPTWTTVSGGTLIPAGTVMIFGQTSAPTGFTKDTTNYNNSALRVVTGSASTGGSVDFSTAFVSQAVSGTVGNTTLSEAQMPSHTHSGQVRVSGAGNEVSTTPSSFNTLGTMGSAGSSSSHNHSFTGTAINLAVKYVDVIRATKD